MISKSTNSKTRNTKNNCNTQLLPAKEVAQLLQVSESTVKKVRAGKRTDETLKGKKVVVFDEFYVNGHSLLIKEISKLIKL